MHKVFLALLLACLASTAQAAGPTGMVVGRTGDILNVSVPEPVSEGTILSVTLPENTTADARVLSCTKEWPYIALAKIGGSDQPAGVVYVRASAPEIALNVSKPSKEKDDRFSLQAGAFYPIYGQLGTGTYLDYWQSYRVNYSLLRLGKVETMLSAEYMKGFSSFMSGSEKGAREMQVIPVTLMGRVKPFRFGSWRLFVGAGAGFYGMHSQDTVAGVTTSNRAGALGHELSAGLEANSWLIEARYRNVPNTEIRGYSLAMGTRF